jgi:hypothetical protein
LITPEIQYQKEWFKQFKTELVQQLTSGIITALRGQEAEVEIITSGLSMKCTCIPVKLDGFTDVVIVVCK